MKIKMESPNEILDSILVNLEKIAFRKNNIILQFIPRVKFLHELYLKVINNEPIAFQKKAQNITIHLQYYTDDVIIEPNELRKGIFNLISAIKKKMIISKRQKAFLNTYKRKAIKLLGVVKGREKYYQEIIDIVESVKKRESYLEIEKKQKKIKKLWEQARNTRAI